jgi:phosphoribosylanthranilate isomerase
MPPTTVFLVASETASAGISGYVHRTPPKVAQSVSHIDPREREKLAALERFVRRVQVIHVKGREVPNELRSLLLSCMLSCFRVAQVGGARAWWTGRRHNREVSAAVAGEAKPVFLAGRLNSYNVMKGIRCVRPFGVGLCSDVRTDEQFDQKKLAAVMEHILADGYLPGTS